MILKVTGLTDSVITLNVLGVTLHGQVSGTFTINNDDQLSEIKLLRKAGLIRVEDIEITQTEKELPKENVVKQTDKKTEKVERKKNKDKPVKKTIGRPKGSKNKSDLILGKNKQAEDLTQRMGSEAVIATGQGTQKVKMQRSFAGEIPESEKTQASLDAMDKAIKEENEEEVEDKPTIDENKLDPSEQMGRNAVISDMGRPKQKKMKNSILPNAADAKDRNPFIDKNDKEDQKDDSKEAFIDKDSRDDPSDTFIES